MVVQLLGFHSQAIVFAAIAADPVAVADGHVEHGVRAEEDFPREVASGLPRVRDEDFLDVLELAAVQAPACDRQRGSTFALFRIRNVHQPVLRELRVDGYPVERVTALARRRGRSPHRIRLQNAVADDPQPAIFLRDKKTPVRQERQTPGMYQPAGYGHDADLPALDI